MANSPDIDTIIVAFNNPTLPDCVAAASAVSKRVIVVNNGDPITNFSSAELIDQGSNLGYGGGQNLGISNSSSEFALLLNPDAVINPEAIESALAYFENPAVAVVQGIIYSNKPNASQIIERSQGREITWGHLLGRSLGIKRLLKYKWGKSLARRSRVFADHADRVPAGPAEVEHIAFTAVLVRKSAMTTVGGFDERFFLYGEDADICRRLRNAGWKLFGLDKEWAAHVGGESSTNWSEREINWWNGTLFFAAKWWGPIEFTAAYLAGVLTTAKIAVTNPKLSVSAIKKLLIEPIKFRRSH